LGDTAGRVIELALPREAEVDGVRRIDRRGLESAYDDYEASREHRRQQEPRRCCI
jgi:hypothetical protein